MTNKDLVKHLKKVGVLKSKNIEEALLHVDRKDFVPEKYSDSAYFDDALPTLKEQTISQPYTVVFMLELLEPKEGHTILDVGSGSCWQTAMLAEIVGEKGKVYGIEVVPEVFEFGKKNIEKYPKLSNRIELYQQNANSGLADTIFDRITVAASVRNVPSEWKEKLKVNGIMVFPKDQGIYKLTKENQTCFKKEFYPGFVFVPFI